MYWGEVGNRQCSASADEFGARAARSHSRLGVDFRPFMQKDVDKLLGAEAPLLAAMVGHTFADRWQVEEFDKLLFIIIDLSE